MKVANMSKLPLARLALLFTLVAFLGLGLNSAANASMVKGIYLTESTLVDTPYLNYLIRQAKASGINTFVVDLERPGKKYEANIQLLKENHIAYIARVVVFPEGGKPEQISSPAFWAKKYALIQAALNYGADQIQLDYIRYNTKQPASPQNAKNILRVIQWYKDKLAAQNIPLQIDVFGISAFGESKHIGQNVKLFAQAVDAVCPMVYPSHFEPYLEHAVTPYQTIFKALTALKGQFDGKIPVKVYAYIELSNYRYPLSSTKRVAYINAQIKAVKDAGADGWFAWSAHNKYDYLFRILTAENENSAEPKPVQTAQAPEEEPVMQSLSMLNLNSGGVDLSTMSLPEVALSSTLLDKSNFKHS
jgi:hypothetical protein